MSNKQERDEILSSMFHSGTVAHYLNNMLGELLTLADAAYADPIQRKAHKDILKTKFYDTAYKIQRDRDHCIASSAGTIGEILKDGSRSIDPELDMENGKFKNS